MKRTLRLILAGTLAAGTAFVEISTFTSHNTSVAMAADNDTHGNIIEVATGPGMEKVTTLVTAIKAADLVDALKGPGPFTVFAPTNEAFAKLPKETLDDLLKPENKDKLKAILLGHVHAGEAISSHDLHDGKLTTLSGKDIKVKIEGPTITVDDSTVTKSDVQASNGVIHWIDTVIVP